MNEIYACAEIRSSVDLMSLGRELSARIFHGIQFQGLEEGIMDEVPAIFIKPDFMGIQIVLYEDRPSVYMLTVSSFPFLLAYGQRFKTKITSKIEIYEHLVAILQFHGFDAVSGRLKKAAD